LDQLVHFHHVIESLEPEVAEAPGDDLQMNAFEGIASCQDVGAELLVEALEPESQVHSLPHRGVLESVRAPHVADARRAGVQPHARAHGQRPRLSIERPKSLPQQQGGPTRPRPVILLFLRGVPEREDGVPDEFDDGALRCVHAVDGPLIVAIEQRHQVFGVHAFRDA